MTIYWYIYRERSGYKNEIYEKERKCSSEMFDIASLIGGS